MLPLLTGRRILLGISGSIAAYKAPELIRRLIKAGAEVRTVLTPAASRFVTPLVLETLTRAPVLTEERESWSSDVNHIGYARWADLVIVAPATVNTLAKAAMGLGDNLLLQVLLATRAPLLFAPAANTAMLEHPSTLLHRATLISRGVTIVEPAYGQLACGEEGSGALAELDEIVWQAARILSQPVLAGRRVVISGGGTAEAIDGVRLLTNRSSGKMAKALAQAAWLAGGEVMLVGRLDDAGLPRQVVVRYAESSQALMDELAAALKWAKEGESKPILFMAAAVSDYLPATRSTNKIKKEEMGSRWVLELIQNSDLLMSLERNGVVTVGFKAETDPLRATEYAMRMLKTKKIDAVALNVISDENPFGGDTNAMSWIDRHGIEKLPVASKFVVAQELIARAARIV